jgi:hypothetical protein
MTRTDCRSTTSHRFFRKERRRNGWGNYRTVWIKVRLRDSLLDDDVCVKCGKTRKEVVDGYAILPLTKNGIIGTTWSYAQIKINYNLSHSISSISKALKTDGFYRERYRGKWKKKEESVINAKETHTHTHAHT